MNIIRSIIRAAITLLPILCHVPALLSRPPPARRVIYSFVIYEYFDRGVNILYSLNLHLGAVIGRRVGGGWVTRRGE